MGHLDPPAEGPRAALICRVCYSAYHTTPTTDNACPICRGEEWLVVGVDHRHPRGAGDHGQSEGAEGQP